MSTMMLHRSVVVVVQTLALDYLTLRYLVLADFQLAVDPEVRMNRQGRSAAELVLTPVAPVVVVAAIRSRG